MEKVVHRMDLIGLKFPTLTEARGGPIKRSLPCSGTGNRIRAEKSRAEVCLIWLQDIWLRNYCYYARRTPIELEYLKTRNILFSGAASDFGSFLSPQLATFL